jgi:hypothetical protein
LQDGGEAGMSIPARQSLQGAANAFQGRFAGKAPGPVEAVLVVLQIAIRTSNEPLKRLTFLQDLESRRRITHPENILQISKHNL